MYPIDRRKLAHHVYSLFNSLRKTAIVFQVSHSTIHRWLQNPEKKKYYRVSKKADDIVQIIKATVVSNPFITVRSFVTVIKDSLKINVSRELVRVVIKRLGLTSKKAKFFATPKRLEETTKLFIECRKEFINQGRYIVSLDETSFGRYGKPMFGYSPKGTPLVLSKKPLTKAKPTSVLAIIDSNGLVVKEHLVGPYNKVLFTEFLRKSQLPPHTVILLDNVRFHHSSTVKDLASERQWELLYIPPYSPWFNPIEEAFSIVKRQYYKHWNIDQSFESLKPSHCKAFFDHSFKKN